MSEGEDRTQAPSARRRQMARERGQVVHSPELTGAAGLLAAAAALAVGGEALAGALLAAVREPLAAAAPLTADAADVVASLRRAAAVAGGPVLAIAAAAAAGALAAHQAQVRGLWAPALLAPDPSRLWAPGRAGGLAARAGRGLWAVAKAAAVAAVAAGSVRSGWSDFARLSGLDTPELARAAGAALARLALALAAATLALGAVDFGLQWFRFEALLRLTPAEQREDFRSVEGDPALRARRRRIARARQGDPAELLAGASLVLTGPAGLTVVLCGGPPPRRVTVRTALSGPEGDRVRRAAGPAQVPVRDAPDLARRLGRRPTPGLPPAPDLLDALTPLWP